MHFHKLLTTFILFTLLLTNSFANTEKKKVSLQLSWFDQFQFAGYYIAKEKGFYEEEGLEVDIKTYNSNINIVDKVDEGIIDFAIGREDLVLKKVNLNKDIVVLYALFQASPLSLISKKNSSIDSLKKLKNKKIMSTFDDANELSLKAMINASNIDFSDLKFLKHTHNINDLISNKTDLISAYISKAPFHLEKNGIEYNIFHAKDYGFDLYSDFLYTSKKLIKSDIQKVKAFKRASIKGWKYAYENIEEAVELILKKYNSQNLTKDELLFEAFELKKLSYFKTSNLGEIKASKLYRIFDLYKIMGTVNTNVELEDFYLENKIPSFIFSKEENRFLNNNKEFIFAINKQISPYFIDSINNSLSGYDKDVVDLINNFTGLNIKLIVNEKQNEMFDNLEIDGLSSTIRDEKKKYLFTNSYLSLKKMIITTKKNPNKIKSLNDLENKNIGVLKQNYDRVYSLESFSKTELTKFDSYEELIKDLVYGNVDAIVADTGIFNYANKISLPYLQVSFLLEENFELSFNISKQLPLLHSIINKTLEFTKDNELKNIQEKWFWNVEDSYYSKSDNEAFLNKSEWDYLSNKKSISVCIYSKWLPYGNIDAFGNYRGINADIINLISKKLGIDFVPVFSNNENDALNKLANNKCSISYIDDLLKVENGNIDYSSSYLQRPLVIATKKEEFFIGNILDIKSKKILVVKDSDIYKILKKTYPFLNLSEVNSASEGLMLVNNHEAFAYIDLPESLEYNLKRNSLLNIKISGQIDKKMSMVFAFNKEDIVLKNIFDKIIKSITIEEKQEILNSWAAVKFEKEINYELIWQIVASFFVLILILIIFFIKQNKLKKEIIELNRTLEKRVRLEVEKNREKDSTLFRQSRFASMGEMIGNIAHQWRQPLNRINLNLSVLSELAQENEFNSKIATDKIKSAEKNIKYMSETIEDFINFFNPDKKKTDFLVVNTINTSLKLLESRFTDIKVTLPKDKNIIITGFENEFLQVLLVILNNAVDNFNLTGEENKKIHIFLVEYVDYIELSISDNSGGIAQEHIEKIFEPYFTTKFKKEGAGIGLYMAKMIIEKSMSGTLSVSSINKNTTFSIKLPKFQELIND